MAVTYSQTIDLGTKAPAFDLPAANPPKDAPNRTRYRLSDFDDARALVVVFMCNHCPYVLHIEDELLRVARAYQPKGVAFVGINANDPEQYPDDSFEKMAERAAAKDYPFPYLFDATQEVAKAYGATCTPDLYVFDRERRLVYHGRFDATRPRSGQKPDGRDLRRVLDELLTTGKVTTEQYPSMGCNIKWKPGNEPAYFG
ncbi:thioredoxin family protein [Rhodocaloribacter litoris]|uniref:thioredoxin family protein n=1 Tax=Rhodocaloribacter litoris TaxID=2558931 RepID=UPI00141FE9F9|nr:thioredoxin family protein [Rhodocaloribacter litoris]QXD16461.1 thioredoxin family protein [Rhodocaloribacter litoris]GIV59431.1 MAG: thioredoxin family protein [Rhodothermaceae bacterium]